MIPGTSCLATIVLSLRDKSHSPIEAPHNYLSAYGVYPGERSFIASGLKGQSRGGSSGGVHRLLGGMEV
jgi:hypothetical protein